MVLRLSSLILVPIPTPLPTAYSMSGTDLAKRATSLTPLVIGKLLPPPTPAIMEFELRYAYSAKSTPRNRFI
eukprot:691135-Rhodomonas_salina.1